MSKDGVGGGGVEGGSFLKASGCSQTAPGWRVCWDGGHCKFYCVDMLKKNLLCDVQEAEEDLLWGKTHLWMQIIKKIKDLWS